MMPSIKTSSLLAITAAVLSISSPGIAGFTPGHGDADCDYVRRNINSRLPKGINLDRSVVREISINGRTSRECIVYGNPTAIQYAWQVTCQTNITSWFSLTSFLELTLKRIFPQKRSLPISIFCPLTRSNSFKIW
jgi:hypothetical protein